MSRKRIRSDEYWRAYEKRYRQEHATQIAQYQKAYRAANKTRLDQQRRDKYRRNPEYLRNRQLLKDFGISLDEYKLRHAKQQGLCAICKYPNSARGKTLAVDHNHQTGQVRELLCSNCNNSLGHFKEDPERMRRAIAYIEFWNK